MGFLCKEKEQSWKNGKGEEWARIQMNIFRHFSLVSRREAKFSTWKKRQVKFHAPSAAETFSTRVEARWLWSTLASLFRLPLETFFFLFFFFSLLFLPSLFNFFSLSSFSFFFALTYIRQSLCTVFLTNCKRRKFSRLTTLESIALFTVAFTIDRLWEIKK